MEEKSERLDLRAEKRVGVVASGRRCRRARLIYTGLPKGHGLITYCSVLRTFPDEKCKAWESSYTPSLHVSATTPPTFIYATTDDKTVPVSTSVDFYSALVKAGVPAEIHLFRYGGHASGLGEGDPALEMWPRLLENWLRAQGFL
jgi:acetyl esterase/lipase